MASATPSRRWAYQVPARMLALVQRAGITRRRQAFLFGHSAGADFAQRMMLLTDRSPYCAVVAANANWYALPTLLRPFPEGIGGLGLTDADVESRLAWPLTILAGEADLDTSGPSVPDAAGGAGAGRQPLRPREAPAGLRPGRGGAPRRALPLAARDGAGHRP